MLDLTFGEQVKIILKRKGMTIKELAKLIEEQTGKKMSRQNMTQRLNRDNFQEQDMRTIASILGCPFQLNILGEDTAAENDSMEHIQEVAAEPEKEIVEETVEEVYEEPEEEVYEESTKEVYEEPEEEVYKEPTEEIFYEEEPVEEVTEEIYEEPVEEPVEEYDDFRETEELIRETFEEENREEVSEVTTGEAEETTSEQEEPESTAEDEEPTAKSEEPVKKKKHHSWKDYFQRMTGKHADKEAEGVKQAEVEEQKQQPEQEASPKQEPVPEPEITEPEEEYKEELGEEFTEPEAEVEVSPVEEEFAEAFEEAVAKENEQEEETEDLSIGEMNPYTGREYESNSVRMHPKRIGYVQVYSRKDHKWQDMTEWAFLGEQERKKVELGDDYVSPIYLD